MIFKERGSSDCSIMLTFHQNVKDDQFKNERQVDLFGVLFFFFFGPLKSLWAFLIQKLSPQETNSDQRREKVSSPELVE